MTEGWAVGARGGVQCILETVDITHLEVESHAKSAVLWSGSDVSERLGVNSSGLMDSQSARSWASEDERRRGEESEKGESDHGWR